MPQNGDCIVEWSKRRPQRAIPLVRDPVIEEVLTMEKQIVEVFRVYKE